MIHFVLDAYREEAFTIDFECLALFVQRPHANLLCPLDKIVDSNYDVLTRRIRVPTWEKLWILIFSKFKR